MQALTTALGNYGLTKPLKDGAVAPQRHQPQYVEIKEIVPAMRRMCRGLEYDICEMAFTTYLCARAMGKPFTAIPVFVTRNFHHWAISINAKSGIKEPKDLEGRVVGVNRGYTVTTGLWARGILQSEYGVDLDKITFVPTDDEHVSEFVAPKNVDYARFRGRSLAELLVNQRDRRRDRRDQGGLARHQAAHTGRPQRRVRLFPPHRRLSDQPRPRRQEFAAQRISPGLPTICWARSRRRRRSI